MVECAQSDSTHFRSSFNRQIKSQAYPSLAREKVKTNKTAERKDFTARKIVLQDQRIKTSFHQLQNQ